MSTSLVSYHALMSLYSTLDATGGPYPTSSQYVIDVFAKLQSWTNFCNAAIPLQNFADYVRPPCTSLLPQSVC